MRNRIAGMLPPPCFAAIRGGLASPYRYREVAASIATIDRAPDRRARMIQGFLVAHDADPTRHALAKWPIESDGARMTERFAIYPRGTEPPGDFRAAAARYPTLVLVWDGA